MWYLIPLTFLYWVYAIICIKQSKAKTRRRLAWLLEPLFSVCRLIMTPVICLVIQGPLSAL